MTKVLVVTTLNFWPPHGGELIRCHHIIDSLCEHFGVILLAPTLEDCPLEARVERWYPLAPSLRGQRVPAFRYVLARDPRIARPLRSVLDEERPTVTWFEQYYWGQYVPIVRRYGTRAIMDTANVESDLARQQSEVASLPVDRVRRWSSWRLQRWHEHRLFPRFDRVLAVSEPDRAYYAGLMGDDRCDLLPNFVNQSWYAGETPRDPRRIVVTGNFGSFQNRAGVAWFLGEVWPRILVELETARLTLVGHKVSLLASLIDDRRIELAEDVPSIVPYLKRAGVAVVPLLHGSGSRFKILEALACGTPVVSTPVGASGLQVTAGQDILLANHPDAFARAILDLLQNPQLCLRLGRGGRELIRRLYGYKANTQKVHDIITDILRER